MRRQAKNGKISAQAIAGTYVVLLGIDIDEQWANDSGLRGFAIRRTDHTENEPAKFLENFRRFSGFEKEPSSDVNPFQEFVWSDYTAKEDHSYTFQIVAKYGTPGQLLNGPEVSVSIDTENSSSAAHKIYFNRGVAASQAYARKFHNESPEKVEGGAAFRWLSRGLEEALVAFIERANSSEYELRAAVYEFKYPPVLHAFANAAKRGADVKIIVDEKKNSKQEPRKENIEAVGEEGIADLVIPRESNPSYIAHNKFIVLRKNGKSVAVWTGSTNISEGGIFGQSNVGHLVEDGSVAEAYFLLWNELSNDPEAKAVKPWNEEATPLPDASKIPTGTLSIFSPRSSLDALEFYTECMRNAKSSVFFTAAFGINETFKKVLEEKTDFLRYVLLESLFVQKGKKREIDEDIIYLMKRDPNDRFAVGAYLKGDVLDKWLKEKLSGLNVHVRYVHTKYMLIDPLEDESVLITGSANFSEASTTKNDENMLVVRGDRRSADIYLTEFMRLFHHYDFRNRVYPVSPKLKREGRARTIKRGPGAPLDETDEWWKRFYVANSPRAKERILFGPR